VAALATLIGMPMLFHWLPHYIISFWPQYWNGYTDLYAKCHFNIQLELFGYGKGCLDHGISIYHSYWHAKWHADAMVLVSILPKTINNSCTLFIIHITVQLELLAWGTIHSATALSSATSINMMSGVPMPFHWPPHYTKR
jgi:hypothetical protein